MTTATLLLNQAKSSKVFIILLGVAALTASAKIQVPLYPVPVTFQTAVVLLMPCLLGWRLALAVLASYFAAGALGLPVFAGPAVGPAYFMGPTGGYLAGFAAALILTGMTFERKSTWSFPLLGVLMLAGHAVILALGFIWLAYGLPSLGADKAFVSGVAPFLIGSVIKSVIAAALIKSMQK